MPKVYVATPAYGCVVKNSYLASLLMARAHCHKRGIPTMVECIGNESLITRARNLLVELFLGTDCTHLLFIDADVSFAEDTIASMVDADKDIVCGIYPKKSYIWSKVSLENTNEPVDQQGLDYNINLEKQTPIEKGRYCKVLDAATGFMMIKRDVIVNMKEAYASLTCTNDVIGYTTADGKPIESYVAMFDTMIDPETRRYLSEDYAFCRRWQLLGGEIWADLSLSFGHEGFYRYAKDIVPR